MDTLTQRYLDALHGLCQTLAAQNQAEIRHQATVGALDTMREIFGLIGSPDDADMRQLKFVTLKEALDVFIDSVKDA